MDPAGSVLPESGCLLHVRVSKKPILHNPENRQINQAAAMNGVGGRDKQPSVHRLIASFSSQGRYFWEWLEWPYRGPTRRVSCLPRRQLQRRAGGGSLQGERAARASRINWHQAGSPGGGGEAGGGPLAADTSRVSQRCPRGRRSRGRRGSRAPTPLLSRERAGLHLPGARAPLLIGRAPSSGRRAAILALLPPLGRAPACSLTPRQPPRRRGGGGQGAAARLATAPREGRCKPGRGGVALPGMRGLAWPSSLRCAGRPWVSSWSGFLSGQSGLPSWGAPRWPSPVWPRWPFRPAVADPADPAGLRLR